MLLNYVSSEGGMELSRVKIYRHWRQRLAWCQHFLKACFKHKERPRVRRLAEFIPPNGVVFDVGAHFGYLAKEFARIHDGSCRVYCFEPVSYTHSILKWVMRRHHNARLEQFALSSEQGRANISIPVKSSGRLGIGLSHLGEESVWDFITESIRTEKLDDYVASQRLQRLDFIKMDVEGAELLVLRGAEHVLETLHPAVYCEVATDWTERLGYHPDELFAFMESKGYQPHVLGQHGVVSVEGYGGADDYLFLWRPSASGAG